MTDNNAITNKTDSIKYFMGTHLGCSNSILYVCNDLKSELLCLWRHLFLEYSPGFNSTRLVMLTLIISNLNIDRWRRFYNTS